MLIIQNCQWKNILHAWMKARTSTKFSPPREALSNLCLSHHRAVLVHCENRRPCTPAKPRIKCSKQMLPQTPEWQQQNEHRKEPDRFLFWSETQDLLFRVHKPCMDHFRGIPEKQGRAVCSGFLIPHSPFPNCPFSTSDQGYSSFLEKESTVQSINDSPAIRCDSSSAKLWTEHFRKIQLNSGPALKKLLVNQSQYGEVSTGTKGHILPKGAKVIGEL